MKIYRIDSAYLDHLRQVEPKVPNSAGENYTQPKPYVGVVLNVSGNDFLAPLSSPKPWHKNGPGVFMLHARNDETDALGIIALKFMVPAPARVITEIDFSQQDTDYAVLLEKQYQYIKTKWGKIQLKAQKLYDDVVVAPKPHLQGATCDFQALIQQSLTYP